MKLQRERESNEFIFIMESRVREGVKVDNYRTLGLEISAIIIAICFFFYFDTFPNKELLKKSLLLIVEM